MHFTEVLESIAKQQNKNFNEVALIFRLPSKPSTERNDFST